MTLQVMSYNMSRTQDVINELVKRKKSISCNGSKGLLLYLESLGFKHKEGKTVGHRIFTHPQLSSISDYKTHSVDCGHKPNRDMKHAYITNTLRVLNQYKDELEEIEANDK